MDFLDNKPIYQQIVDYCHRQLASGTWPAGARVPAVKELAIELTVNPRTVLKAYETLTDEGIISLRRGMGYYSSPDAKDRVLDAQRRHFMDVTIPRIIETIDALDLNPHSIAALIAGE